VHRLELARAESEPLAFRVTVPLPAGIGDEDVVPVGEAEVSGELVKTSRGFMLSGTVRGEAKLRCSRCLKPFEVRFFEAPELDLAELAGEQLQLAVPMKPLCHNGCPGLCPRCGADLNLGRCACAPGTDERWASLHGWRPGKP